MFYANLRRSLFETYVLASIFAYSLMRFRFWWMQRRGQGEQAQQNALNTVADFSRRVFRRINCRVEVTGQENVPRDQAFVLMSNHQSKYDIILLSGFLPQPLGFVAKKSLFRIPGFSYWMRRIKSISLDRTDIKGGVTALHDLGEALRAERRGIIIFPEGTRSRDPDGEILPFHQGSLRLATSQNLPIVPVAIDGTRFLDRGRCFLYARPEERVVRMRILPVRIPGKNNPRERKEFMSDIHETIVSTWKNIRVKWKDC